MDKFQSHGFKTISVEGIADNVSFFTGIFFEVIQVFLVGILAVLESLAAHAEGGLGTGRYLTQALFMPSHSFREGILPGQ